VKVPHQPLNPYTPEKLNELFDKLGKLEGATSHLRGALFEFLIAEVIRATSHPASIELNKMIKTIDSRQAEIDVFAPQVVGNELIFAECKGLNPNTTLQDEEVDKWLDKRITVIRQYCLENSEWRNKRLIFQLWTTAKLSEESQRKLETVIRVRTKYRIEVFDKVAIDRKLKDADLKQLLATFRVHFLGQHAIG